MVENRHGLVLAVTVNSSVDNREPLAAVSLVDRVKKRFGIRPKTLGADKGFDQAPFQQAMEQRRMTPHVAVKAGVIGGKSRWYREARQKQIQVRRRMKRRMSTKGYTISQRCRKKIEGLFGWTKTIGGLARTRSIGHWKTNQQAHVAAAAFNLTRLRGLCV